MSKKLQIAIVGGGTGGHITPALAVAEELKKEHSVWFIGSTHGPEGDIIRRMDYPFYGIAAGKLRRYLSHENITDLLKIGLGFFQSLGILIKNRPDVLFAKGGYVTVPAVYAASLLGIPVVAHESDVIMGLANKLVFDKARVVCTGFPETVYAKPMRKKLRFTGNPIRSIFRARYSKPETMRELDFSMRRPVLLVLGGSQGAQSINALLWENLPDLLEITQVIHLTGTTHGKKATAIKDHLSPKLQKRYQPFGFVGEELPAYMNAADIVVSRSSASVMAELVAFRKPMLLIPLRTSASDHQRANAQAYRKGEAALMVDEVGLTSKYLLTIIEKLIEHPEKQRELAQATGSFDSPQAAALIAETIITTAQKRK